jgi:hypothetical protein
MRTMPLWSTLRYCRLALTAASVGFLCAVHVSLLRSVHCRARIQLKGKKKGSKCIFYALIAGKARGQAAAEVLEDDCGTSERS